MSIALVNENGPFSLFDQVDRTLHVMDGSGISLTFSPKNQKLLKHGDTLLGFRADADVDATLISGGTLDLNVMTNRNFVHHIVFRLE
ncbi:HutD family protein [Shimia abyssi]|uniref:HutD family protein n=1 Tax=Shimia abyssi TaxID=1662395 RepID=UPI000D0DB221